MPLAPRPTSRARGLAAPAARSFTRYVTESRVYGAALLGAGVALAAGLVGMADTAAVRHRVSNPPLHGSTLAWRQPASNKAYTAASGRGTIPHRTQGCSAPSVRGTIPHRAQGFSAASGRGAIPHRTQGASIRVWRLAEPSGGAIAPPQATSEYASLFGSSKLVHVSTIDFAILSAFLVRSAERESRTARARRLAPLFLLQPTGPRLACHPRGQFEPIREDMCRRGWWDEGADDNNVARLAAFSAVPVLGPAAYLMVRPALQEE